MTGQEEKEKIGIVEAKGEQWLFSFAIIIALSFSFFFHRYQQSKKKKKKRNKLDVMENIFLWMRSRLVLVLKILLVPIQDSFQRHCETKHNNKSPEIILKTKEKL